MQGSRPGVFANFIAILGFSTFAVAARGADDKALAAPPGYPSKVLPALPGYASPQEAFAARREAFARRDWRTAFASLTPAVQDQEVSELVAGWTWLEEGGEGGPYRNLDLIGRATALAGLRGIVKQHGLDYPQLNAGYDRIYLVRHGVDLAKLREDLESRYRERTEYDFREHPQERAIFPTIAYLLGNPPSKRFPPGPGEGPDPIIPRDDEDVDYQAINVLAARVADKAGFYA